HQRGAQYLCHPYCTRWAPLATRCKRRPGGNATDCLLRKFHLSTCYRSAKNLRKGKGHVAITTAGTQLGTTACNDDILFTSYRICGRRSKTCGGQLIGP